MMSESTWIKLHRKIRRNPLWYSEPLTKAQAWVDLLLIANRFDGFIYVRGKKVHVKRGQVGYSEVKLAELWQWSRGKVRRFLNDLKTEQQIVQQTDNRSSLITICNYDLYQLEDEADNTADGTASSTTNGQQTEQQTDSKRYTNKERKKDRKKKEETNTSNKFAADSPEMKLAKYFFSLLQKSNRNQKEPNWQSWCSDLDLFLRIDKPEKSDIKKVLDWAHDPRNATERFSWIPNLRSPKKLREHFEKILLQTKIKKPQPTSQADYFEQLLNEKSDITLSKDDYGPSE